MILICCVSTRCLSKFYSMSKRKRPNELAGNGSATGDLPPRIAAGARSRGFADAPPHSERASTLSR